MISPFFTSDSKGKNSAAKGKDSAANGNGPDVTVPASHDAAPDPNLTRLVLGLKFDGSGAFDYFRPPLVRFAAALAAVEAPPSTSAAKWDSCAPLPAGIWLHRRPSGNMPLLPMSGAHSVRFRRICGFAGEIKFINDEPADVIGFQSPVMLTVITKVWWRYGPHKAEMHDSWAWRRILTRRNPLFEIPSFEGFLHTGVRHRGLVWRIDGNHCHRRSGFRPRGSHVWHPFNGPTRRAE